MTAIIGVAFPIPKRYMTRFFDDGKTVFVKPATTFKELRRGMKMVFYQSQVETGYAGEARIKRIIVTDDPLSFFETFGDAVFLTPDEMKTYAGDRRGGGKKISWMALELEDVRRYTSIEKPDRIVPAGGKYLKE